MKKLWWMLALAVLLAAGCGQPKQKVVVETDLPPVDFSIRPPAETLEFSVEGSMIMEVMGTSMDNFFRFNWRASRWKEEGDSVRTVDVRFSDVQATERRGQTATPETIKSFDRLEGYSTRFRLDSDGFEPMSDPARDGEFMQAFSMLTQGLSTLDFRWPERPMAPGESWEEIVSREDLGQMGVVAADSVIMLTYTGNTRYKRRDCARVEFKLDIPIDGEMQQGPATSRLTGSILSEGAGLYDPELGFFVFLRNSSTTKIKGVDFDEDGKQMGGEKSFSQTGNMEITYLGL